MLAVDARDVVDSSAESQHPLAPLCAADFSFAEVYAGFSSLSDAAGQLGAFPMGFIEKEVLDRQFLEEHQWSIMEQL